MLGFALGTALGTQEQFSNYGDNVLFPLCFSSCIPSMPIKGCDSSNTISQGRVLNPGGIKEEWKSLEKDRSLQDMEQEEILFISDKVRQMHFECSPRWLLLHMS